jgi:hypothetical protein
MTEQDAFEIRKFLEERWMKFLDTFWDIAIFAMISISAYWLVDFSMLMIGQAIDGYVPDEQKQHCNYSTENEGVDDWCKRGEGRVAWKTVHLMF